MIHVAKAFFADSFDPYYNLAVEEYLLDSVRLDECILYLWQNAKTVVLGRNQNAYKECRVDKLLSDGGVLARRLSGGGCVYHDHGNLNFTFFAGEADYDVARQLSVIVKALEPFGLFAINSGRNDICIDGRKFSGNAFYKRNRRCYHHGTILVDVDTAKMSEYLSASAEKLSSKGVASVRSRVVNLRELNPEIDVPGMKASLVSAFGEVYGAQPLHISNESLDGGTISKLYDKYASAGWVYGDHMKADYVFGGRFPWGEIEFNLKIRADSIVDALVFSDAMDGDAAGAYIRMLKGAPFRRDAVLDALSGIGEDIEPDIALDVYGLFKGQDIWG